LTGKDHFSQPGSAQIAMPYAELHAKTSFSFLEGASHPDELVRRAAELGYAALEIRTGKVLWRHSLPAGPVRWGVGGEGKMAEWTTEQGE
jgi:hypothetical protein